MSHTNPPPEEPNDPLPGTNGSIRPSPPVDDPQTIVDRNCVDAFFDGPGDTTIRPMRPSLRRQVRPDRRPDAAP